MKKQKLTDPTNFINKLFPSPDKVCNPGFVGRETDKCVGYFYYTNLLGHLVDKGEEFEINPDTTYNLFGSYSFDDMAVDLYEWSQDPRFDNQEGLGVQTNIIFSSHFPTRQQFHYKHNPMSKTMLGEYYTFDESMKLEVFDKTDPKNPSEPLKGDILYKAGDSSVLTTATVAPAVKWAYEFENKAPNSKPVTFNELCGTYNPRLSPYKNADFKAGETLSVKKNEFGGIPCKCRNKGLNGENEGMKCDHQNMNGDPGTVEFVLNACLDRQKAKNFKIPSAIDLEKLVQTCTVFNMEFDYSLYRKEEKV